MNNQHEIKVRGYHIDTFGHVNNARFLEYFEDARWEWYETLSESKSLLRTDLIFTVVNININYRHYALLGQTLMVDCVLEKTGNRSVTLKQTIHEKQSGTLIADASIVVVMVDPKSHKALPVSEYLAQAN